MKAAQISAVDAPALFAHSEKLIRPPVLVLGSGVSALGVLRILRRAGLTAYVPDPTEDLVKLSRWYRPVPGAEPVQIQNFENWLRKAPISGAVLMPCSDEWVAAVAALPASLRERFPASVPDPEALLRFVDKGRFAETLREVGTAHPKSSIVDTEADLARVPDEDFRTAILKPRDSQRFFRRFRVKAFHVSSRDDAREKLARLREEGHAVILQQFVPGPPTQHYFVDGFVDRHGVMRAIFVRQRIRMHPADFGNSSYMVSVPPEEATEAVEAITKLLHDTGYRGMFSAEFKRDPRDGVFNLLEVNVRAWWYVDFAARCGVDVCLMAYEDALGQPVENVTRYAVGRTLVYPYLDFFACKDEWRQGKLSLWGWARAWIGAMQPVFQFSDPVPGARGTAAIIRSFLARRIRRVFSTVVHRAEHPA